VLFDPRTIREELSVMLLVHLTDLNGKPRGDNSMSETAGSRETAYLYACLGPIGMVKARLLEPQCPSSKLVCPDTAEIPEPGWGGLSGGLLKRLTGHYRRREDGKVNPPIPHAPEDGVVMNDQKDTNRAPNPI